MFHVIPAGMNSIKKSRTALDLDKLRNELNPKLAAYREFLEELFAKDEVDTNQVIVDDFQRTHLQFPEMELLQQIDAKEKIEVFFSGMVIDLLNLRPEICFLILIKDEIWYDQCFSVSSKLAIKANWEWRHRYPTIVELDEKTFSEIDWETKLVKRYHFLRPNNMVSVGAAAFWLGVDIVRKVIYRK